MNTVQSSTLIVKAGTRERHGNMPASSKAFDRINNVEQVLWDAIPAGKVEVADVPAPAVRPGSLLVRTAATLISPGTERMLVEFGQAGLLGKARAQPEKVRQLVTKIRTDGVKPALEAVASRLDEPLPLGYSNVGRVLAVGEAVTGFAPGQRVVSSGAHAEIVCVPATLAAAVPAPAPDPRRATVGRPAAQQGEPPARILGAWRRLESVDGGGIRDQRA
jgi:hypothetical protein